MTLDGRKEITKSLYGSWRVEVEKNLMTSGRQVLSFSSSDKNSEDHKPLCSRHSYK